MSEPISAVELARLRARADQGIWFDPKDARYLFAQVDRLEQDMADLLTRAVRAEADLATAEDERDDANARLHQCRADLADEKRRRAERVESLIEHWLAIHAEWTIIPKLADDMRRALLDTATEETGP